MTSSTKLDAELSSEEIAKRVRAEELDNSELFDVHTWSEYPEVNKAVDALYAELLKDPKFSSKGKGEKERSDVITIKKKHIKVIILDLYVKWLEDPQKYSSFYRMRNRYSELEERYNKLNISYKTVTVVDSLEKKGYLELIKGHLDRTGAKTSHISRMRATDKLISLIKDDYEINPEMVELYPHLECIILRDYDAKRNKRDIPYVDDRRTIGWRNELYRYNNLLRRTFIDIPHFPKEGVYGRSKKRKIKINRNDKFVRRIFSNGTFKDGGRFYGGWWQRLPKEWRGKIKINDSPVVEIDYSGLHIVMLYAKEGIDYWKVIGNDPYELVGIEKSERMRGLLKLILLCAINAKDKISAIKAVNQRINQDIDDYRWVKEEKINLTELIDKFAKKHKTISDNYFFTGYGVKLQHLDSLIAEQIINLMTKKDIPVLCIHDSFIVQSDKEGLLRDYMQLSFDVVLGGFRDFESTLAEVKSTGVSKVEAEVERETQPKSALKDIDYEDRLKAHRETTWTDHYKPKEAESPDTFSGVTIDIN